MIEGKETLLGVWFCLAIATCALPYLLLMRQPSAAPAGRLNVALAAMAGGLLVIRGVSGFTSPLVLALVLLLPLSRAGGPAILGGLIALPLFATVTWWLPRMVLGPWRILAFLGAGLFVAALCRLPSRAVGVPARPILAAFLLLGLAEALLTAPFNAPIGFWMMWHHWGAYVSPVYSMLSGAVPFRDFPVQYGMGPTLLIAALSGQDPWPGTYVAVAAINVLYMLVMASCVLLVSREAPRGQTLLVLLAMAIAIMFWTGFPADLLGTMATPSVGGMRFLPVAILLMHILRTESLGRPGTIVGYAIWFANLLWSPESAAYATLVWFPYLGLRSAQSRGTREFTAVAGAVARGAGVAAAALAAAVIVLALTFRAAFGDWISIFGFLTYIRNVPGTMPPNTQGPIWLILTVLAIGAIALTREEPRGLRTGASCLLGLTAVSSYYLGRSHDNNVLNLFPFMVLVLSFALSRPLSPLLAGFSRVVLAGIVIWPVTFGFASWSAAIASGDAGTIGPARLLDRMHLVTPDAWALTDASNLRLAYVPASNKDAGEALAWLTEQRAGPPLIISPLMIVPRHELSLEWTSFNNLANFGELPPDVIVHFIRRGAEAFHRPGWILVDRAMPGPWLELFKTTYDVTDDRVFGGYTAYRVAPK